MEEPIQMDIKVEEEEIFCQYYQPNIINSSSIQLEKSFEANNQGTKDGSKDFESISTLSRNYCDIYNNDNEEHECTLCARLFQSEKLFKAHIKEHLKMDELPSYSGGAEEFQTIEDSETKDADPQSVPSEKSAHVHKNTNGSPYKCLHCPKKYATKRKLENLQVDDNEIKNKIREAMDKKRKRMEAEFQNINEVYQCSLCAMTFNAKKPFQKHMTRSHKAYSCYLCDYSHRKEDYVLLHMNLHEGRNVNQCRYCDKEFTTKLSTIRHMEVHRDIKKYQCDKCGMCFSQTTILYNHKLQHEAEEKPLRCEICMQMFKTKRTYQHHLITHRADRPRYTCEYCGRNFTEKYTLKVHKRTHHKEPEHVREESVGNHQAVSAI